MFWVNEENFKTLTPKEIKEQIRMRMHGLKSKRGTGVPKPDILERDITTLKKLYREITKK